jgi:hypothetical protein
MKISLKICLLLNILVLLTGCSTPQNCIRSEFPSAIAFDPIIKLSNDAPVLFNADIKVLKYHFSGLIAFRRMADSSTIRIVFLTAVGLKMMEFSYSNGKVSNSYCLEALKKKSAIKLVDKFLEMLLEQRVVKKTCYNSTLNKSGYFCKLNKGCAELEFTENMKSRILLKECNKKTADAIYSLSSNLPDEINVKMKYKTVIQLKKVDNAFK